MGFFDRLKAGLAKTREKLADKIDELLHGSVKIDDELLDELEETLIMSDVGTKTTEKLMTNLRKGVRKAEIKTSDDVKKFLSNQIREILLEEEGFTGVEVTPPYVILMIGVNGAGKTTTIGKLSAYYKEGGKKVMVAAADTFRAGAIEQLEIWAKRTGAEIIKHNEGTNPSSVALDAVRSAVAGNFDVLIVDTAGRLQNKFNLMEELKKINRIIGKGIAGAPHEVLLVLDATTGQNALRQAELFSKSANITGIVLTKLDGTAKGGMIIGIKEELNIPVKWVGVGEGLDDLRPFNAKEFADALFGIEE
ncbi:MAG: signal recognition particle-docking protein FtsY [Selenomonadaceae bacterium]|nr:signal recognition particle-docking protein FtsY [Selenomonadaceae bacterium]